MERDQQYLLDMLQSARILRSYVEGQTQEDLITNIQLQDAIIRRLSIIGEASNRISDSTQQTLSNIPWAAIRGMRNRLVHEYDGVNLNVVWDTIIYRLPDLILELEKVVPPPP